METDEIYSAAVIPLTAEDRGGLVRHATPDLESQVLRRDASPRAATAPASAPSDLWNKGRVPSAAPPPSAPHLAPVGAPTDSHIIGSSAAARLLREKIRLYAEEREAVLVTGETGCGKELVARELHRLSGRGDDKFVPVNIGGVPEGLASSELFGHVKGAFTGAVSEFEGA
ncbi:MAG: sigma-54 factor interaction domain-containing protein, partial [Parvularculaceae bacterium]|nr:sigma-54 factor interaction domain-containing protein [Parvularculaceae bacterium]